MNASDQLLALAYKAERSASRRLADASGISMDAALRHTLASVAGSKGLASLLAERAAMQARAATGAAARLLRKADALAARRARHDGEPTAWRAWFDGSAHPNPGRCGIGALLVGPDGAQVEISQPAGYGNSSEAEYRALIAVLAAAVDAGAHELTVYGDSRVVIDDVSAGDDAAAPSLRDYRARAVALLAQLPDATLRWLPRHKNSVADALSQRGVQAG